MSYVPSGRSELEKQFETLFERTFQCPVEDMLIPQHKVNVGGKTFIIDYVYLSDSEAIAIELDGRGKFQDKKYYNYFMRRHNALMNSNFQVFHLTWDDVVKNNGLEARKVLRDIFVRIIKDRKRHNTDSSPQRRDFKFAPELIALALGALVICGFYSSQLEHKNTLVKIPSQPVPTTGISAPKKPVQAPKPSKMSIKAEPIQPIMNPKLAIEPKQAASPPTNLPKKPVQASQDTDPQKPREELVVFNTETLNYFNLGSFWARKCSKNCITVSKAQAEAQGGHPARSYKSSFP